MNPGRITVYVLLAVIPPLALGVATLVLENMSLGPQGNIGHSHAAGIISLLTSLVPLVLLLLGFVALVYVKNRLVGLMLVVCCVTFTIVASSIIDLRQKIRDSAFEQLVLRSEPLVRAIHEYEDIRGLAPEKLVHIVPQYVREIPTTQLGAYPDFEYRKISDPALMAGNTWLLELSISTSPESRLVYLPGQNYDVLEGIKQPVVNWVYVYQRPPGREQAE